MKVRWTLKARNSLFTATEYIRKANPEAAIKILTKIHESTSHLSAIPYIAPDSQDFPGYRELFISDYPFVIWYQVKEDENLVEITFVWHTAQNRNQTT
jgi:toxin ParE1/3/4